MNFPSNLFYTKTHEWARHEGNKLMVGITDYAQKEISDVVFVELPKVGKAVEQFKPAAVIESVKAAFDIYAPASGKIIRVNTDLEANPAIVNQSCYENGWLFEMEISDAAQIKNLLSSQLYEQRLKTEAK